ncbi:hypothetical protein K458DRAFT_172296 [Lentithecium fluviatile CBS 122367]|uniref:Uncharacterized protein n=1 Tax=Lentithecium fluviatile CBS 122367 TaxID=1168545 RepID=A0A6G1JBH3_9PLEO|nr:hypothetical protein K458DRAFT_172296 [Lentithecium fluviatile CBS 122367]
MFSGFREMCSYFLWTDRCLSISSSVSTVFLSHFRLVGHSSQMPGDLTTFPSLIYLVGSCPQSYRAMHWDRMCWAALYRIFEYMKIFRKSWHILVIEVCSAETSFSDQNSSGRCFNDRASTPHWRGNQGPKPKSTFFQAYEIPLRTQSNPTQANWELNPRWRCRYVQHPRRHLPSLLHHPSI